MYEKQCKAFEVLGTREEDGSYHLRFEYDKKGECPREEFGQRFTENYPNLTFAQCAENMSNTKTSEDISKKIIDSRSRNKNLPPLESIAKTWKVTGQQTNACRLSIVSAMADYNFSRAEIARFICREIYSSPKNPWNGVAKDDHIYKRIYSTVDRIHHGQVAKSG